ncbi:hypothetical protein [Streptomyces spectabilis]|uniref:Uncharacterized protein n=1 Tax=Streptomyces spectabilis TaxID=68270 RepID=A0A7W8B3U8_STRST|nr:hypothetical protein [Streptomyces spectabilis]MBB5109457.1 hypothetical protein [Streptomyces spectabilis]MCI3907805.1 hypothetical protein [Streptomyces spectabilis]GGV53477.1 hypothetical protein GCM10010245_84440 [Streptomyces spectabilis]
MDDPSTNPFADWLLHRAHLAGYDPDARDTHDTVSILAALALDEGLNPEQTIALAHSLDVTPQEVTDAYLGEMRQRTLTQLLDHPCLAALDAHLDVIARTG